MARSRFAKAEKPELKKVYRVVRNSCFHAGIEYKIGDILPELPIAALNVHLPNVEMVEVEEVFTEAEPTPETAIAVIDQVKADGGANYDVQL